MSRKSELEEYFTPVQPRVESRFSENAMREIHEGRAQYAPPSKAAPQRAQRYRRPVQPQPVEDADEEAEDEEEADVKPRKKKHRFLRFLLKLVFFVLLLAALAGGSLLLLAKMPRSTQPIGTRKDGCATILLAGTDMGGERTDTIMLLFLDTEEQTMRLLSIPRDTMVNRDNPSRSIPDGAYVAIQKTALSTPLWGEAYALATDDGCIIKRLYPSEREGCVRCVSINADEFPAFELRTDEIHDYGLVKAVITVAIWR